MFWVFLREVRRVPDDSTCDNIHILPTYPMVCVWGKDKFFAGKFRLKYLIYKYILGHQNLTEALLRFCRSGTSFVPVMHCTRTG
ncbi:hypothetical protein TH25_15060 [Thalassospira profundimaris]|uniref:Uncharacterized protein n=1 Tax=Thalassospira profundimaris TaxID=502049 RepID=A0A367X3X0_9PROT|nr:hypothetical protein TH25_15060 [Thalassospira profundimaris]